MPALVSKKRVNLRCRAFWEETQAKAKAKCEVIKALTGLRGQNLRGANNLSP